MNKEITPGLFSETDGNDLLRGRQFTPMPDFANVELSSLGAVAETKRLEKRLEGLITELRAKQEETQKTLNARYEAFLQKLTGLESRFEALAQDLRSKYSTMASKITEHNLTDMKTQALIDRHNQILRQSEQRMSQLQRVAEEQEFQLMNFRAALDEARKEIARMKRL